MSYCKWTRDGERLTLSTKKGSWHFIMPADWRIKDTHPDLFKLAELVLLYPFLTNEIDDEPWAPTRKNGKHPGLSYSTGVDSTAAMCLMPQDTQLVYFERDYSREVNPHKLNHANAYRAIKQLHNLERYVVSVKSDSELIRKAYSPLNQGFSTDYHCGVGLILLADYLDLDSFGTGMVLESAYLYCGYKYREFADTLYWQKWNALFSTVGLPIYQPVAGCSEIITEKIIADCKLDAVACSCIRGAEGSTCGKCYKCYRKGAAGGDLTPKSEAVTDILNHTPLKMASSMIYTMQKAGESAIIPNPLRPYFGLDVSWLEGYYPPSLALIPEKYRALTKTNLEKHCAPMAEPYKMHTWNVEHGPA